MDDILRKKEIEVKMSWRNHRTHKEETRAVKKALNNAGINCTVGHGTGTAWGWIEVNIGKGCELHEKARKIVEEVTGRHGEYSEILILSQDAYNKKLDKLVPIIQPYKGV